jgi:hypothetical protein
VFTLFAHVASIAVALPRLAATILASVALAGMGATSGMVAAGASTLAAPTASAIGAAFVASTRHDRDGEVGLLLWKSIQKSELCLFPF